MVINVLSKVIIGTVVTKALLALGIGLLTFTGFTAVLNLIQDQAIYAFGNAGTTASNILGLMGFDVFISYIFSAYTCVFALRVIKRFKII